MEEENVFSFMCLFLLLVVTPAGCGDRTQNKVQGGLSTLRRNKGFWIPVQRSLCVSHNQRQWSSCNSSSPSPPSPQLAPDPGEVFLLLKPFEHLFNELAVKILPAFISSMASVFLTEYQQNKTQSKNPPIFKMRLL